MNNILLHAHSGLRWIALLLLVVAIINAFISKGKNSYVKKDKMINLFAMIFLHIQLLIGSGLYFISENVKFPNGWMKIPLYRFFGMEHLLMMLLSVIIITIGRNKSETLTDAGAKHKKIAVWYTIGLLILIAGIPWPFRTALGGEWF